MLLNRFKKLSLFILIVIIVFAITSCSNNNPFDDRGSGRPYETNIKITLIPEGDISALNLDEVIDENKFRVILRPNGQLDFSQSLTEKNNWNIDEDAGGLVWDGNIELRDEHDVTVFYTGWETGDRKSFARSSSHKTIRFVIEEEAKDSDDEDNNDDSDNDNGNDDGEDGDGDDDNGEDDGGGDDDNGDDNGEDDEENEEIEGDLFADIKIDKISMDELDIYSLKFADYSQIDMADKVYLKINHSGDTIIYTVDKLKDGDEFYVDSNVESDKYPKVDIALLDSENKQQARANDVEISESLTEIDFITDVDDEVITSSFNSGSVSALSVNYLASHTIDMSDDVGSFNEKWHDFQLSSNLDYGMPSGYLVINDKAIEINFDFSKIEDSFIDIFNREHDMSGGKVENMDLYYRLSSQTPLRDARSQDVAGNQEDVLANITDLYVNDGGGTPPYPRASAPISFEHIPHYDNNSNQVHLYRITVHQSGEGIAGLPEARSFTAGEPANDSRAFGESLEITSDSELDEITIYILGMKADEMEGEGTASNPFKISTPEQLNDVLRYNVSGPGIHYILTADIDMENFDGWYPIGSESRPFQGNLDGQLYEITNLEIDQPGRAGLFGSVGDNAIIENIYLNNFTVNGGRYVGTLAGRSSGTIRNITIRADGDSSVYGQDQYVGGLVGQNYNGLISNSTVRGDVSSDGEYVGGLAGANTDATIENSTSEAAVTGVEAVGGLVGWNNSDDDIYQSSDQADDYNIKKSIARGDVSGVTEVGGLVGLNDSSVYDSIYELGTIDGERYYIGGFIGTNNGTASDSLVENAQVNGYNSVGGLVGINRNDLMDNRVINVSANGENNNIGGLVGDNREDGDLRRSEFVGDVSGLHNVGGLAGRNTGDDKNRGVHYNQVHIDNDITGAEEETTSRFIGLNRGFSSNNGGIGFLTVEIIDAPKRVVPGMDLDVFAKIENIGDRPAEQDLRFEIDSVISDDSSHQDFTLAGDSKTKIEFSYVISEFAQHGEKEVVIRSDDDFDATTIEIVENLESDNKIASLNIDNVSNFNFDPDTTDYEVDAAYDEDNVDVTAELSDEEYASMQMSVDDGELETIESGVTEIVNLNDSGQSTEIEIVVTAENGDTNRYNVNINREENPNIAKIVSADFQPESTYANSEVQFEYDVELENLADVSGDNNIIHFKVEGFEPESFEYEFAKRDIETDDTINISSQEIIDTPAASGMYDVKITSVDLDGTAYDISNEYYMDQIEVLEKVYTINGKIKLHKSVNIDPGEEFVVNIVRDVNQDNFKRTFTSNTRDESYDYSFGVDTSGTYEITVELHEDSSNNFDEADYNFDYINEEVTVDNPNTPGDVDEIVISAIAPELGGVTVGPGSSTGTTKISAATEPTNYTHEDWFVNVTTDEIDTPAIGDSKPTEGINGYVLDDDIESGDVEKEVVVGNWLQLYSLNIYGQVIGFYQQQLESNDINN